MLYDMTYSSTRQNNLWTSPASDLRAFKVPRKSKLVHPPYAAKYIDFRRISSQHKYLERFANQTKVENNILEQTLKPWCPAGKVSLSLKTENALAIIFLTLETGLWIMQLTLGFDHQQLRNHRLQKSLQIN